MTDSPFSTDRYGRWAVGSVALCLGMAGSLCLTGMTDLLRAILDPMPRTTVLAIVVALGCAAVGPWLPQRLISRRLRHRGSGWSSSSPTLHWRLLIHGITPAQQGLMWVVLAVICLAGGIASLMLLWATGPLDSAHGWLTDRLLLSPTELLIGDAVLTASCLAVSWLAMGLAVACVYALSATTESSRGTEGHIDGVIVLGAGCGLVVASSEILVSSPIRTALLGTLPLFVAATVSVLRAGRRRPIEAGEAPVGMPLPERAPEAGYAILATLAVWGATLGVTLAVWPRVVWTGLTVSQGINGLLQPWLLLTTGTGILVGGGLAKRSTNSVGASGPVMLMSGAATGLSIGVIGSLGLVASPRPSAWSMAATITVTAALGIGEFAAGIAFPYLKRAVVQQSGSPALACAQVLTATLTGIAVGVILAVCLIIPLAGTLVALAAAALVSLAAGGLLIIFDVGHPVRHRRRRLIAVFSVLIVLMIAIPGVSGNWLRWRKDIAAVREGSWLTLCLVKHDRETEMTIEPVPRHTAHPSSEDDMCRALAAVMRLRGRINSCLLISMGDLDSGPLLSAECGRILEACYDPEGRSLLGEASASKGDSLTVPDRSAQPILRSLRCLRERYDLIVIEPVVGGHPANQAIWSLETFRRLRRHLAPRGLLVGLVRPVDYDSSELAILSATFSVALPGDSLAGLVGDGVDQVLALMATSEPAPALHWSAAADAGILRVGPVSSFLEVARGVLPHSLRTPSLIRLGGSGEGGLQFARFVSEKGSWRRLTASRGPQTIWPPLPGSNGPE